MEAMEDYDTFVRRRLTQLRKSREEEEGQPGPSSSSSSSVIRFYGRPILPPLLSGTRREEMQHHRDEMQEAAVCRKFRVDSRLAYMQTILHSVQLRKTPTLEELLQESEITPRSVSSHNNDSVPQRNVFFGTKESLSPPPASEDNSGFSLPRLTSTTYSAFSDSDRTAQQSPREGCLIDRLDSQQESQPSSLNGAGHQSLSSGYVTYENVENSASVSGGIDGGSESRGFGSSEGFLNMGGFFHHNTSNTIAKMPDIISHPPVDGEELERSGLEAPFGSDLSGGKDVFSTSYPEDSMACDCLPAEKSESSCLDSVEQEDDNPPVSLQGEDFDHPEESVTGLSDNSDISQMTSDRHVSATEQVQHSSKEAEADSAPSEESYRVSLQALLKKSQEYRRRQRMLRNQAKNTKIQERTQEQPRARAEEEQSLSDKENAEFPRKGGTTAAEGKKTKERRGTLPPSVETSTNQSPEKEKMMEDEIILKRMMDKSESKCSTEDGNTNELTSSEKETTLKNNQLNSSQEMKTSHKQISAFSQQQPAPAETSLHSESFYLTTCSTAFHKGPRKHRTVPAPVFCRSPTGFKSRSSFKDGQTAGGETSAGPFRTGLNEDRKVEGPHQGRPDSQRAASPTVRPAVAEESNLSVLKVLISDLEATVKENLDNRCQTESNTQSESDFSGIKHGEQSGNDRYMQQGQRDDQCWDEFYPLPIRQSFNNSKGMSGSLGHEANLSAIGSDPVQVHQREAESPDEQRPEENSSTERGKAKEVVKKQPAKCIFSVAQQKLIPEFFRNAPSDPNAASDVSVLSDAGGRSAERREASAAAEGRHPSRSPSLNQSYDVDTPSGLWLQEGSGSDAGSQGRPLQDEHRTPESCGEGQGGVSKVKRRLLMHRTEEGLKTSGGAGGSAVSPSCSTPRAAVRCCAADGALKDKQEQLKRLHAAQVRALQDQHRRQQEELLQALAVRYRLLQSVSFPCSMSSSRLGDTLTFPTPSQLASPPPQRYRPLLAAAAKGFLTRRLLRTERVAQLVRTIRDTQQFLQAFQQQLSPGQEFCSRQDLLLQERVALQLRAARYEVYDVFFSLTAREQMQLIGWDRELTRERELRRQSGHADHPGGKGKSSLSAATQKSLERKRGVLIQKKAAERQRKGLTRTRQRTGPSPEQPPESKRGQFRANPQRVPKSTFSSRPR